MRMRKLKLVAAIVAIVCLCAIMGLAYLRMCVFKAPAPEAPQQHTSVIVHRQG